MNFKAYVNAGETVSLFNAATSNNEYVKQLGDTKFYEILQSSVWLLCIRNFYTIIEHRFVLDCCLAYLCD